MPINLFVSLLFLNIKSCQLTPVSGNYCVLSVQLLLDEPTNHLDMESIDALAKAVNEFEGGMVLVSHDMRLISQCAEQIYICDNKKVELYKGDIMDFKLHTKKANSKKLAQHMNG